VRAGSPSPRGTSDHGVLPARCDGPCPYPCPTLEISAPPRPHDLSHLHEIMGIRANTYHPKPLPCIAYLQTAAHAMLIPNPLSTRQPV
jgi:hypothetical protein